MTLEEARTRVKRIESMMGDSEAAHSEEDALHQDVLRYLAEVAPAELALLAQIALSTEALNFERWCA